MNDDAVISHRLAMGQGDGWHDASRYQIWTKSFDAALPDPAFFERRPEGLIAIPSRPRLFHVAPAEIPYRIKHLFGFYRISGSDTIFIRVQNESSISLTLIVGTHAQTFGTDFYAWFCPQCGRELARVPFQTKRFGMAAYWSEAAARVREFNSSDARRIWPSCTAEHPIAYGFEPDADTPEERAAREAW